MKPITIGNDLSVVSEPCEMLSKFGIAHGITNAIQVGVGIGYPIISVGKNWEIASS